MGNFSTKHYSVTIVTNVTAVFGRTHMDGEKIYYYIYIYIYIYKYNNRIESE